MAQNQNTEEGRQHIRSIATAEPFPAAMQRLNEFAALTAGWDTYRAAPIAATAIAEARSFLSALARRFAGQTDIAKPFFLSPLPYGGVQIEWHRPNQEIEIEIDSDGHFGYLLITGQGEHRTFEEGDDLSFDEALDRVVRLCNGN